MYASFSQKRTIEGWCLGASGLHADSLSQDMGQFFESTTLPVKMVLTRRTFMLPHGQHSRMQFDADEQLPVLDSLDRVLLTRKESVRSLIKVIISYMYEDAPLASPGYPHSSVQVQPINVPSAVCPHRQR